jgi:iron(III) transport system substrate-binding protein
MRVVAAIVGIVTLASVVGACNRKPPDEVVVYTALDRQFSEPILSRFARQTGIQVRAVYDTESTKTIGLVNRIRAEAQRPRCDVFWNNEILNTIRLKSEGLLQPCHPAEAANYPEQYRDPNGHWFGFAARARVLLVNTTLTEFGDQPASIRDLADPRWQGRAGMAKPLFGTTATHIACLFAALGESETRPLLDAFRLNAVQIVGGNKTCAEMVGRGQLAFGLTDTDDAIEEVDAGHPVRIVFPDAKQGQMGTLLLPNTLALVNGCPHPEAGAQLIDYLLSAGVEQALATGPSGQIPLHRGATKSSRVAKLADVQPMRVDFARAAELFPIAAKYVEQNFLGP